VATVQKLQPAYSRLANLALIVVIDQEFIHMFESIDFSPVRCVARRFQPLWGGFLSHGPVPPGGRRGPVLPGSFNLMVIEH
jgi:hypothetical protein